MKASEGADAQGEAWTPSQLVAHNLTQARELRGFTQAEVAERLRRFTGARWSQVTVAQAEGWASGQRVRLFGADELVALARTFDLPVLYFFLPPEDGRRAMRSADAPTEGWEWEHLLMWVWGHRENLTDLAKRAAPWAHASTMLTVPGELDGATHTAEINRQRLTPEDMVAVAFNGLVRRHLGATVRSGGEAQALATNLRALADAVMAFDEAPPGEYLNVDEVEEITPRCAPGGSTGTRAGPILDCSAEQVGRGLGD